MYEEKANKNELRHNKRIKRLEIKSKLYINSKKYQESNKEIPIELRFLENENKRVTMDLKDHNNKSLRRTRLDRWKYSANYNLINKY